MSKFSKHWDGDCHLRKIAKLLRILRVLSFLMGKYLNNFNRFQCKLKVGGLLKGGSISIANFTSTLKA